MAQSNHGWQITSQVADQAINDAAGNTIIGTQVYYITNDGNRGVVFIPDNLLTVAHVQATVAADAKRRDDIGRLSQNYTGGN